MNAVAFMPIRLNSKRVAAKSVRLLGGRPLFCWMLEELDKLDIPVHVYCSRIEELAKLVDFSARNVVYTRRPEELDTDETKGIDIYKRFAQDNPADIYLLTHCTSPFIKAETLRRVLDEVRGGKARCALTVRRVQTFTWFDGAPLNFSIPRIQTQLLKPLFVETSAAYCYRKEVLAEGDRSDLKPSLIEVAWPEDEDIDYPEDFERCEKILPLIAKK